jgi:hypothetical protein
MPTFPQLFTLDSSSRHEVLLISPKTSLKDLSGQITTAVADSPNTAEFMSKYKKAGGEKVSEIKVKWSTAGRDPKTWPQSTVLTDGNVEAVLRLIEDSGVGKDVLEVKMEKEKE